MGKENVTFTIGGKLAPSYKGALSSAVTEAQAANQKIVSGNAANAKLQDMIQTKLDNVNKRIAGYKTDSWEYVQATQRKMRLEKQLLDIQNAGFTRVAREKAAVLAKETAINEAANAERVRSNRATLAAIIIQEREAATAQEAIIAEELAAQKAAEIARLTTIATGGGASASAPGGGSHGGGGISGIMRESLVVVRELVSGKGFGRVAGSVTLLAQYMGVLGKVLTSTAAPALAASHAASKLSSTMAVAALSATTLAKTDVEVAAAAKLTQAALAQETIATQAATDAQIALNVAKVSVNPLAWALIAGAAVAAVLVGWAWHLHNLAVKAKNLHDFMGPLKESFLNWRDALQSAETEHAQYLEYLDKIGNKADDVSEKIGTLCDQIEAQAEAEIELMRAQGKSNKEIEERKQKALQDQIDVVNFEKAKLDYQQKQQDAMRDQAEVNYEQDITVGEDRKKNLEDKIKVTEELVKQAEAQIEEKNKAGKRVTTKSHTQTVPTGMGAASFEVVDASRAYGDEDKFDVGNESTGKMTTSLGALKEKLKELDSQKNGIDQTLATSKEIVETMKDWSSKTEAQREEATKKVSELVAKQALNATHMKTAELTDKKKGEKKIDAAHKDLGETAREKSGIYSSVYSMKMHDTAKEQLKTLKSIDRKMGGAGNKGRNPHGANAGDGSIE